MSTSRKTTRRCPDRKPLRQGLTLVTSVLTTLGLALPALASAAPVHCSLQAPAQSRAGEPVLLTMTLRNDGEAALQVLRWNTAFEGAWFGPWVKVRRDGRALPYQGPQMKRGEPDPAHYVDLPARGQRSASLDLGLVYDLGKPGLYEIEPAVVLHDVRVAGTSGERRPQTPACAKLKLKIVP